MENLATHGNTFSQPSIFECIGVEKMNDLFKPIFIHLLHSLAPKYPRIVLPAVRYQDEVYLFLMAFVEYFYIFKFDGSLAEHYYGLVRRKSDNSVLSLTDKWLALCSLLMVPYVKAKFDQLFELLKHSIRSLKYKKFHLCVSSSFDIVSLIFNIAYTFKRSIYYTPWMKLIDQVYKYDDNIESESTETSSSILIPSVMLFLRFIDAHGEGGNLGGNRKKFNDTPKPPVVLPSKLAKPIDALKCPLCNKKAVNPFSIPSGYIFCYRCISSYVEKFKKCPVTFHQTNADDIRRIYLD